MNIFAFWASTVLGAGIWVLVPAAMGNWFGRNEKVVIENLHWITQMQNFRIAFVLIVLGNYTGYRKKL